MLTVAVILAGSGKSDGSEIHESVLTLLALDKAGIAYECLSLDKPQSRVVNHLTDEETDETRNIIVESARIARGKIKNICEVNVDDYSAAIYPGGFGVAFNLCDFARSGKDCVVDSDILKFAQSMAKMRKPQGFICISPVMISKIYNAPVKQTIGNDKDVAEAIIKMGGVHISSKQTEAVIDLEHKVVSTPAYMMDESIAKVAQGINALVHEVLELLK